MATLGSVESTHGKVSQKVDLARTAVGRLRSALDGLLSVSPIGTELRIAAEGHLKLNLIEDDLDRVSADYHVNMADVLANYYADRDTPRTTKKYYRILAAESFADKIDSIVKRLRDAIQNSVNGIRERVGAPAIQQPTGGRRGVSQRGTRSATRGQRGGRRGGRGVRDADYDLSAYGVGGGQTNGSTNDSTNGQSGRGSGGAPGSALGAGQGAITAQLPIEERAKVDQCIMLMAQAQRDLTQSLAVEVEIRVAKIDYETCKCGRRMTVLPENSELICACGRTKELIGAVFKDNQFYPQEGQKTKHTDYTPNRHYQFWIERIQGLENKTFADADRAKIDAVIARDGILPCELNVELMRKILKECGLSTQLNEHATLLVKLCGGTPPPLLTFHENKLASTRFDKIMELYAEINPAGKNRPYYPFFIYKILETMFDGNVEKLRILNYIHLQTRCTTIKNDGYYRQICARARPEDGLIYRAVDPACRLDVY